MFTGCAFCCHIVSDWEAHLNVATYFIFYFWVYTHLFMCICVHIYELHIEWKSRWWSSVLPVPSLKAALNLKIVYWTLRVQSSCAKRPMSTWRPKRHFSCPNSAHRLSGEKEEDWVIIPPKTDSVISKLELSLTVRELVTPYLYGAFRRVSRSCGRLCREMAQVPVSMAVDVEKKSTSELFRGDSLKCLLVALICVVRKRTESKRKTLLHIHCAAILGCGANGLGLCWRKKTRELLLEWRGLLVLCDNYKNRIVGCLWLNPCC